MGFYNLEKIREEALKIATGHKTLHELEINGEKQDDDEDIDYTGDDTGEQEPDDAEGAEADYTTPEEDTPEGGDGDVDYTVDDGGDTGEGEGTGGENPEGGGDDAGAGGGDDGSGGDGDAAAMAAQDAPEETDYTIPDDASPETPEAIPQDAGTADDVGDGGEENVDYTADDTGAETTDTATGADGTAVPDAGSGTDDAANVDYTQDGGGDVGGGDATGAEGDTPETTDGSGGSAVNDELNQIEDQLMADLSDEQKQIQSDELRKNFLELYNTVLDVIDKVNNIHKEESTLQVFEFISTQLLILKDIINTNITRSFDTKTYIENNIDYQHCLAILNAVRIMIDETNKKTQKAKEE